nr:hypothetical protein [Gemmatimonadaceae bacterium]
MTRPRSRFRAGALVAAAVLLPAASACDKSAPEGADTVAVGAPYPPPPAPARVASAQADTVPLESLVMWDAAGAQVALASAGLRPRVARTELVAPGLPNGIALRVGDAEVHLFFFGDIAAADAAYQRLDVRSVRSVEPSSGVPAGMINNNMLAVIVGGDAALRQRIVRSLHPGAEDSGNAHVEP